MAESTLSLTNLDIAKDIGFYVGYTRDETAWTTEQKENLSSCLDDGYRQFLIPPMVGGRVHEWTFLRPIASLVVWPDVAATTGVTVTQSGTTLTANTDKFYPSMVGRTVVITGQSTDRTITGYTSPTVVTVSVTQTIGVAATFSIASEGRFRLADDFAGLDGLVTFSSATQQWANLPLTNEMEIRALEQVYTAVGQPRMCAVIANNAAGSNGQRFDLALHPWPQQLYTLKFRYNANPGAFSTLTGSPITELYPLGGMPHAETIKASCMAVAEEKLMDGGQGIYAQRWMSRLQSSVEYDVRTMTPEYLGYNGDNSDLRARQGRHGARVEQNFYVTHNGVMPT